MSETIKSQSPNEQPQVEQTAPEQENSMAVYLFHQGSNYKCYEYLGCQKSENDTFSAPGRPMPETSISPVLSATGTPDAGRCTRSAIRVSGGRNPRLSQYDLYKIVVESRMGNCSIMLTLMQPTTKPAPVPLPRSTTCRIISGETVPWIAQREKGGAVGKPMNIYEMHAGSWRKFESGDTLDYDSLADQLIPYIQEMGIPTLN